MPKSAIQTDTAPGAVGPYSQAIAANGIVFLSGQLGLIPGTRNFAEGGVRGQTAQALKNVIALLEAAGTSLDNAVKTTVFLKDMNDFAAMNETYATFFASTPPARSTVEVARLPLDGLVEIEIIALL
jgi:2-iminobutanoate/2-iminopropanoate deaminase